MIPTLLFRRCVDFEKLLAQFDFCVRDLVDVLFEILEGFSFSLLMFYKNSFSLCFLLKHII